MTAPTIRLDMEDASPEVYSRYYSVRTYCTNCDKHDQVYVRKGKPKKGLSYKCPNCRCEVSL